MLTCAVCGRLSDAHPHHVAFYDTWVDQTGPVISTIVQSDTGDAPKDRVIFWVHLKDVSPVALRVLSNLIQLFYIFLNYKMTVILYADFSRKGKLKGDVGAEEPSDFRVILDCVETKEEQL